MYVFDAEDIGDRHLLNKMLAPKKLGINDDAPVMLLRNANDKFVNGLIGGILSIESECINVLFKFDGKPAVLNATRCCFSKYNLITNKCLAKRYQFPLRLAYAFTIHKSQGITIRYVEIDCRPASNAG